MGLSLAAISLVTAAEEEQATGNNNSIRRRPVIYSRDAETAEIDDVGRRHLAITDLFQPPSAKRGQEDAPSGASDDLFGSDRTSNVAAAADSEGRPNPYIVNGIDVPPNKFPWFTAAIKLPAAGTSLAAIGGSLFGGCAGQLIASDWILTAAHVSDVHMLRRAIISAN
jgi:hypothetical protein